MALIDDINLKELHCKNDDCRKLLGYEKINSGILAFDCPRCKTRSVFRIRYSKGSEFMDKMQSLPKVTQIEKGGDK